MPEAASKGLPEPELQQGQEPGHQNQNMGNKGNWGNSRTEGGGLGTGQPGSFGGCGKSKSRLQGDRRSGAGRSFIAPIFRGPRLVGPQQLAPEASFPPLEGKVKSESEVDQSCPTLCGPMDCTCQAPPSMGFSRQDYWSGLPFPSPGDLPNPGIKPGSPALQADSLPSEPQGGFTIRGQQRSNFWKFGSLLRGSVGVGGVEGLGFGPWQPRSLTCLALPSLIFLPWIHFWASKCFCRQGPLFPWEDEKMTSTLQSFPVSRQIYYLPASTCSLVLTKSS